MCGYLGAKMEKFEDSSIGSGIRTYGQSSAYNFVDFRSKRACCSNYRSASFARVSERQKGQGKSRKEKGKREVKSV